MGGGSKKTSSSTEGSAQKWAQPYARAGASSVQSVFNQNQPGLQDLTNQARGFAGDVRSSWDANQGNVGASRSFIGDVLGGKYLNGNPHLDAMIAKMRGGITDTVNSQFSQAGRYGSDAHGSGLTRELGNMETGLRYQNYGDEMNRMSGAVNAAQGMSEADSRALLAALGIGAEIPYVGANSLGGALGALFNGGTSTSKEKGQSPIWGALGAGAAAAGSIWCDRRLKTDIKHVLTLEDGLPMYSFEYKAGMGLPEGRFVGPMADEVAELRPEALRGEVGGYMTVDANLVARL